MSLSNPHHRRNAPLLRPPAPEIDQAVAEARAAVIDAQFLAYGGPDERMALLVAAMNLPSAVMVVVTEALEPDEPDPVDVPVPYIDRHSAEDARASADSATNSADADQLAGIVEQAKRMNLGVRHLRDDLIELLAKPSNSVRFKGTRAEVQNFLAAPVIKLAPTPADKLRARLAATHAWRLDADADGRLTVTKLTEPPTRFYTGELDDVTAFCASKIFNTREAPRSLTLTLDSLTD